MLGHCHGERVVPRDFTWLSLEGHLFFPNVQHGRTLIVPSFLLTSSEHLAKSASSQNPEITLSCWMQLSAVPPAVR